MNIPAPKVGVENTKWQFTWKNGSYSFDYISVFMETI
jgi:hypothetical protein